MLFRSKAPSVSHTGTVSRKTIAALYKARVPSYYRVFRSSEKDTINPDKAAEFIASILMPGESVRALGLEPPWEKTLVVTNERLLRFGDEPRSTRKIESWPFSEIESVSLEPRDIVNTEPNYRVKLVFVQQSTESMPVAGKDAAREIENAIQRGLTERRRSLG